LDKPADQFSTVAKKKVTQVTEKAAVEAKASASLAIAKALDMLTAEHKLARKRT
jgi:hypothetical protein